MVSLTIIFHSHQRPTEAVSRALGLCSAQTAMLRKQDFRLTWSVVVKWCRAMIGHSESGEGGGRSRGVWPELS